MTFEELVNQVKSVPSAESRHCDSESLEMVFIQSELVQVKAALNHYFGDPVKAEGAVPSMDASEIAAPYGGVRRNQVLYFQEKDNHRDIALLWPWSSGGETTVKIIRE